MKMMALKVETQIDPKDPNRSPRRKRATGVYAEQTVGSAELSLTAAIGNSEQKPQKKESFHLPSDLRKRFCQPFAVYF